MLYKVFWEVPIRWKVKGPNASLKFHWWGRAGVSINGAEGMQVRKSGSCASSLYISRAQWKHMTHVTTDKQSATESANSMCMGTCLLQKPHCQGQKAVQKLGTSC
ncbi:heart- and neural crest derivatives-expressed protein 1 [Platysternon megacephalum]|uniref:Heart-and neural crest derivatives-expressed protein 1 n=1 Tax=Platysternon megacephalum TaxID=55544 RepID=A0A4D9ESH7_9SAUR|nr:heart- and neural crest derivatives-expressed protein 1 [Platysternon megacephalum]